MCVALFANFGGLGIFKMMESINLRSFNISDFCRDDVLMALNDAIDRREEGIVIKSPQSIYKPSKRKGNLVSWFPYLSIWCIW